MADRPIHVLLVSADPHLLERVGRLAAELPAGSVTVQSCDPAELPATGPCPFDGVMLDSLLARVDGTALLERVRSRWRTAARLVLLRGGDESILHLSPLRPHALIRMDDLTSRVLELRLRHVLSEQRARRRLGIRKRKLLTVHRIARISLEAETLDEAFRAVVREIGDSTGFPMVGLAAYDAKDDRLVFRATRGLGLGPGETLEVPSDASLSGIVARSGRSLVEPDASGRPELSHPRLLAAGAGALVSVPVKLGGRVLGVLTLAHHRSFVIGPSFLRWLEGIADAIALLLDRLGAREELRRSEGRYRALIENAADTITVLDLDGSIRYQSPAVERLLGHRAEDLEGRSIFDVMHPDEVDEARSLFANMVEHGVSVCTWTGRVRHLDDSWRSVEAALRGLTHDPDVQGIVVNAHDVTGARALEEQLQHSQKLDAVGRLAGGVAHDFNNLLTAITGHARLLLDDLTAMNPMRADLEQILLASERGAALTRQLLAFGRKQVLQPKLVNLGDVVQEIERLLRRLVPEDIELRTMFAPDLQPIRADPTQLDQVIMNLVVNAKDALPAGGRLTIETRNVVLDEAYAAEHEGVRAGPHVALVVSDNGLGMDEATRRRIFEPFFTTKEKGTGLGLPTVYGIVRQSGGHVWVYSEPGRGTTFKLYFPVAAGTVSAKQRTPAPPAGGARSSGVETILVVDDEIAIRALITKSLSRLGYTVLEAGDADEALRVAHSHEGLVHLLLTDLMLPGASGRELAAALRTLHPRLPVVLISGFTREDLTGDGLPEGAVFLEKPFTPGSLARVVRAALDARPQLPNA